MKAHYSCAELAAMKLPEYPTTKKGWYALVERDNWSFKEVKGAGGRGGLKREYTPPATVAKLIAERERIQSDGKAAATIKAIKAQALTEAESERAAKSEAAYTKVWGALTEKGQEIFDAHFDILLAWRNWYADLSKTEKIGRNEGFARFAEAYNAGRIRVAETVKARYTRISARSIQRWVLDNEKNGLITFADQRTLKGGRGQKSTVEQHPALEKALIAVLTEKPHVDSTHLTQILNHARIDQKSGECFWPEISYDSVCRWRRRFSENNAQALLAATNPDAWKSKYLSSLGKHDGGVTRLNQRWEMDGTPADWELIDGRHTASVVIDVWSRRPRIIFSKTPRSETNKALLRHAIVEWGVPEMCKIDNGSDYVSREMMLFFEEMGIGNKCCNYFAPWEKPHVESFIKTYLHSLLELLDAFIGHSVAERSAIEARRTFAEQLFKKNAVVKVDLTVDELQALTDAWIEGTYMTDKHSSLGCSPREKVLSWNGPVRRVASERALDLLLAKPAKRMPVITAKGIRYDNATFIHEVLPLYAGQTADIRLDPIDLGRLIVYIDGEFICIAEDPERTGLDRAEVAAHGRAIQREFINTKRAEYRAARKSLPMTTQELVKDLIMQRARQAGKVAMHPGYTQPHATPAMHQADRASRALEGKPAIADSMIIGGQIMATTPTRKAEIHHLPEPAPTRSDMSAAELYAEHTRIGAALAAGQDVPKTDRNFYERWPDCPQGKAFFRKIAAG